MGDVASALYASNLGKYQESQKNAWKTGFFHQ
jgi:hypothetical protein